MMRKYETKLGRALGLGSSKTGTGHWWAQRVTGVILALLLIWFVSTFVMLVAAPYDMSAGWMRSPWTASLMTLLMLTLFYHGFLGMQVIIEDYVHHEGLKLISLFVTKFASLVFAALSVFSILRLFMN